MHKQKRPWMASFINGLLFFSSAFVCTLLSFLSPSPDPSCILSIVFSPFPRPACISLSLANCYKSKPSFPPLLARQKQQQQQPPNQSTHQSPLSLSSLPRQESTMSSTNCSSSSDASSEYFETGPNILLCKVWAASILLHSVFLCNLIMHSKLTYTSLTIDPRHRSAFLPRRVPGQLGP